MGKLLITCPFVDNFGWTRPKMTDFLGNVGESSYLRSRISNKELTCICRKISHSKQTISLVRRPPI